MKLIIWTCPVYMPQKGRLMGNSSLILDATFTASIKNDGRVIVQVDEQIERPFWGFLTQPRTTLRTFLAWNVCKGG